MRRLLNKTVRLMIPALCFFFYLETLETVENPYPVFIPYADNHDTVAKHTENLDIRTLGLEQPTRWLTPDPLADQYPGWSPYNYTLGNPLRYVDPNGMWLAEYDDEGNIITVRYEEGDTFESLYTQLNLTAEEFADWFDVDLSISPEGMSFDITDIVFASGIGTEFSSDATNMNCFSFCLVATGIFDKEIQVHGGFNFTQEVADLFGFAAVDNVKTGDMQTWTDNNNITHHAAIKVITNQSGNTQYISRPGPGENVQLQNSSSLNRTYPGFQTHNLRFIR